MLIELGDTLFIHMRYGPDKKAQTGTAIVKLSEVARIVRKYIPDSQTEQMSEAELLQEMYQLFKGLVEVRNKEAHSLPPEAKKPLLESQ